MVIGGNVIALDLLDAFQFLASLADAKAIDNDEKVGSVGALQFHQSGEVICIAFWT